MKCLAALCLATALPAADPLLFIYFREPANMGIFYATSDDGYGVHRIVVGGPFGSAGGAPVHRVLRSLPRSQALPGGAVRRLRALDADGGGSAFSGGLQARQLSKNHAKRAPPHRSGEGVTWHSRS